MNRCLFLVFIISFWCLAAYAYNESDISLDEKVSRSDAVFVAQVIALDKSKLQSDGTEYSLAKIELVLKGSVSGHVRVVSRSLFSELNPDCCDVGKRYLFFVKTQPDGSYLSANGRYGIYELPR